ncbi:type VII secretion protein EccB [Mycolicibacterium rutilum]|uniref:Type VII secretion protein EccB n=1 Tax=Mycolicibacterium rutilum TaxID=370526 RepID=A0A1H6LV77_MYCRU|nr:type VII secretion protein EccB [Mycolicibacterium rutilum]SEH92707.1 type VII secretion protein EccB [Mycolicibacterium rutilum]
MAEHSSTRLLISGHRFLKRRMAHALVRGDVRMLDDPLRSQSTAMVAGCVLAVIGVAVCAVLAFLQPRGSLGDTTVVMVRDSGALYVRVDDTWHPVPNLASARLVAGAVTPRLVNAAAVAGARRGPAVGIPGAPDMIAAPLSAEQSGWQVCDDAASTTLIVGRDQAPPAASDSILVSARGEGGAATYLLYDGRRARVDLRSPAVVRALRLDSVVPQPVSRALLDTLPEVPEIAAPSIPAAGQPGPAALHGIRVGTVIRVARAGAAELHVVLATGVQRIGEVAADLIRFSQSHGSREIVTVEPGVLGGVPTVDTLPVALFPARPGTVTEPVVCARWRWSDETGAPDTAVTTARAIPLHGATPVRLAQADESGARVDQVTVTPGHSALVRAAGVSGDGARTGTRYLLTEEGVLYGVRDDEAAERLGLSAPPVPAPWPLLAHLPRGPELSVPEASIARDTAGPTS